MLYGTNMIKDNSVIVCLHGDNDRIAPAEGGAYVAQFTHHRNEQVLYDFASFPFRSFKHVLMAIDDLNHNGGYTRWKGGEVTPLNTFIQRANKLGSTTNTGAKDQPCTRVFHERLNEKGGFVLVKMYPVTGFSNEDFLMETMVAKHGIDFMNHKNFRRQPITCVKKQLIASGHRFSL
jgi:hypothetical protein